MEALEVYTRARTHLAEQYGLDPGPQLRGVRGAILRDQLTVPEAQATPTADQPPRPPPARLPGRWFLGNCPPT